MTRILAFAYGLVSYLIFLGTFLYAIGFLGNFLVPKAIDSEPLGPFGEALLVNLLLLSAFAAFFGMWILNGLPRWYHPLFTNRRFRRATQDRYYIVIEARDPRFDLERTRNFLASLGGAVVEEVNESAED